MLDTGIKVEKEEAKIYPPLPENIYQVELLDINSEKRPTYDTRFFPAEEQELETVFKFQYTLLAGKDKEEELRGRNVWHNFVPATLYISAKGKNVLYRIVEALLGRELTQEEEAEGISGEFLNDLIGKQCRIGTKHKASKDGTKVFDNIDTYYAIEGELEKLTDEEKENARVKVKDEKEEVVEEVAKEVDENGVPF